MIRIVHALLLVVFMLGYVNAQDGINQVVVVNSGQFGNPTERSNIAVFDPFGMSYQVIDSFPVNSIQDLVIEGDHAYVAAQDFIYKYDLDTYERVAEVAFPGVSAHQLEIYEDRIFATNYFAQTSDNLYVLRKSDLAVLDTIHEIASPGGTMTIVANRLYISQNLLGSTDACPPFGCFNDTLGYLAAVDLETNTWVEDIALNNNGSECGRLFSTGFSVYTLNEVANTVTAYQVTSGVSITEDPDAEINTSRYRTEGAVIGGGIVSLFDGGIGRLVPELTSVQSIIDTPVTAFAFDVVNGNFYITATDFFSFNSGYAVDEQGNHLFDFPVGIAPEAIGIQYNTQPVGTDFESESTDTILIDLNDIASDLDGDSVFATGLENAPLNGIVTFLPGGIIQYRSFSPGTADEFRVVVCDDKLNPLCSFVQVTINPASAIVEFEDPSIRVFPNPATEYLTITSKDGRGNTQLFDLAGALVLSSSSSILDVRSLQPGMYILNHQTDTGRKVLPIVIQ